LIKKIKKQKKGINAEFQKCELKKISKFTNYHFLRFDTKREGGADKDPHKS